MIVQLGPRAGDDRAPESPPCPRPPVDAHNSARLGVADTPDDQLDERLPLRSQRLRPRLRPRPRTDPIASTSTSRCCDVRWNPPSPSGAKSGGHTHPGLHGGRDRAWRAIAACISPVRPTWAEGLILRRMVMSSGARSRSRSRTPPRSVGSMRVAPYARGSPARARSAPSMSVVLRLWNPPGGRWASFAQVNSPVASSAGIARSSSASRTQTVGVNTGAVHSIPPHRAAARYGAGRFSQHCGRGAS